MKNILTKFLFLFIFTTTIFGKQIITPRYVYGPNGIITVYNNKTGEVLNGECELLETTKIGGTYINIKGKFKDGLYNGVIYDYSPFGKIESIVEYKNGIKHGKSIDLDINPQNNRLVYIVKCNYTNGKKDGKVIMYYTDFEEMDIFSANNKLEKEGYEGIMRGVYKEEQYKNGILEGMSKIYYKSGQLQAKALYKNGKFNGPMKVYYENGQLKFEGTTVNNGMSGIAKSYYKNGQLKSEGTFVNNVPSGIVKSYHENGQLASEEYYENGQLVK